MRSAVVFFLALAFAACDSQGAVREQLLLSSRLDSLTQQDAGVLALRHTLAMGDSSTVVLDTDVFDDLYLAVGRVRLSEQSGLVDGIHAALSVSPYEIVVSLDTSAVWATAWEGGEINTGFAPVDALTERYDLALGTYYFFPWGDAAVLVSSRALNTVALGHLFAEIPTVRASHPEHRIQNSRDIEAQRAENGWLLDFSIGEGDCPRGCLSRTYWTFVVSDSGEVEYLGTRNSQ